MLTSFKEEKMLITRNENTTARMIFLLLFFFTVTLAGITGCDLNCIYGGDCEEAKSQYPEEYTTVKIERTAEHDFILTEGEVIYGKLTLTDEGAFYQGTLAEAIDVESDECISSFEGRCLLEVPFGPVEINPSEMKQLRKLISAVPPKDCVPNYEWNCSAYQLIHITVDDITAGAYCCGSQSRKYTESFNMLTEYLDLLAGGM